MIAPLVFSAALMLVSLAAPPPAAAAPASSRLSQPLSPTQNLIVENTNISTGEFWDAYTSAEADHRRRAELFLLRMLDATEGLAWCDYAKYKTITLDEKIYGQLKKIVAEQRNERAAGAIVGVLSESFPCGRKP